MTTIDQCGPECHKDNKTKTETNPKRVDRYSHYLVIRGLAWYLSGRAPPSGEFLIRVVRPPQPRVGRYR